MNAQFFFSRYSVDTPFMLVQFDPPSAEIDIATHRYTFLDVFLCVELIMMSKMTFEYIKMAIWLSSPKFKVTADQLPDLHI